MADEPGNPKNLIASLKQSLPGRPPNFADMGEDIRLLGGMHAALRNLGANPAPIEPQALSAVACVSEEMFERIKDKWWLRAAP